MKRYIYIITVCTGLVITHVNAVENTLPSCAVLDFEHTAEASAVDADTLSNLISVEIIRTAAYRVAPRLKVNQALRNRGFEPKSYTTQASAALGAAKILGVDYVVFGTISRQGSKNEASAFLLKRESARLIQGTRAASTGDASAFRTSSAGGMARQLIGSSSQQTKLTPAPSDSAATPSETTPAITTPPQPPAPQPAPAPEHLASALVQPVPSATPVPAMQTTNTVDVPVTQRLSQTTTKVSGQIQHYFRKIHTASKGRLESGIRYRKQNLKKDTANSFVGTINTLDLENDGIPAELFAAWFFHENFGAEISWFNLKASTVTNPEGFSDGDIGVSGPTFSVTGRLTQYRPWTPFASLGIGLFSADFDHAEWWAKGYESEAVWRELGSPDELIKARRMELKDTTGKFLMFGINYAADAHWSFELAYRIMALDVDDHYTITESAEIIIDRGTKTFPLDNTSFLVGARYSF